MAIQPVIINNLLFCKNKSSLKGQLHISDLLRVKDWLASLAGGSGEAVDDCGDLNYELKGDVDGAGQAVLTLVLDVSAIAHCQRCLRPMAVSRHLTFNYMITHLSEAEILNMDDEALDEVDLLTADKEMNLFEMIEDEVIAAIPFSPTHERECAPVSAEAGEKVSPFAVLKGFVKQ